MLGSYIEDIGITPQQFEEARGRGPPSPPAQNQVQLGIFEQVGYRKRLICILALVYMKNHHDNFRIITLIR